MSDPEPRYTTRRHLLAGLAGAAAAALSGCSAMTPFVGKRLEETETIDANGAEALAIDGAIGEITVRGEDRDDVHVEIVKQSSSATADLDALHFRSERTDGRLELRSEYTGDRGLFANRPGMDLDVRLPRSLPVETVTSSVGSVTLSDTVGDLTVETSTGSVEVSDHGGDLYADTSTGSVDVTGLEGTASADASTGAIEVRGADRIGDVSTSTGSVTVDVPAIDGDTALSTSTGSVHAALATDLDADLRVSTSTGSITVDGPNVSVDERDDDTVVGTVGEGGPTLGIETSTGGVTLTSLE